MITYKKNRYYYIKDKNIIAFKCHILFHNKNALIKCTCICACVLKSCFLKIKYFDIVYIVIFYRSQS